MTTLAELPLFAARAHYPAQPGHQHTDTSLEAAQSIAVNAGTLRQSCLDALTQRSGTADQIAARLSESILTIRPRIAELRRLGFIRDTGTRLPNTSGRSAIVWEIIPPLTCVDKTLPSPA
jgi:hypothetical protein